MTYHGRPWWDDLMKVFEEHELRDWSPEEVVLWLTRPTTYLGQLADGTAPRPIDVVVDDPDLVISVAERYLEALRG